MAPQPYLSYCLVLSYLILAVPVTASLLDAAAPPKQKLLFKEECSGSCSDDGADEVSLIQRTLSHKSYAIEVAKEKYEHFAKFDMEQLPYYHTKYNWTTGDRFLFAWVVAMLVLFDVAIVPRMEHNMMNHAVVMAFMGLVGAGFGTYIFVQYGSQIGEAWSLCYCLEIAQSVSNLFSLHVIFRAFAVRNDDYVKVMTCGTYLAMVLRLLFFANLYRFGKLDYGTNLVVGIILLLVAGVAIYELEVEGPVEERPAVMFWKWVMGSRLQENTYGDEAGNFFTRDIDGRFQVTILFVLVFVIGFVDLTLSLDNVATQQFEIKSVYIMSTSCVFAMYALRELFYIVTDLAAYFEYRQYCFATVLIFCAIQMITSCWIRLPMWIPLVFVFVVCLASLVASARKEQSNSKSSAEATQGTMGNPQDDTQEEPAVKTNFFFSRPEDAAATGANNTS